QNAGFRISSSCCRDVITLKSPAISSLPSIHEVWRIQLRIPFQPAIDVGLRLVAPPIAQIAARLAVLEGQQQHDGNRRDSPLKYELHRDAEQFTVEEASQKKRHRRDQQYGDEILILEVQEGHARSKVAIYGRFVQWIVNSISKSLAAQTIRRGEPFRRA